MIKSKELSIFRHLGAIIYDSLLILAIFMLISFIFVGFNKGEPILGTAKLLLQLAYLIGWGLFYAYFVSQQGQTLGMRAWKLFIAAENNKKPNFVIALKRWIFSLLFYYSAPLIILGLNLKTYLAAILLIIMFLINYFSIKTNQQNRSIIDLLSKTKLLQLDKNPYTKKTKL